LHFGQTVRVALTLALTLGTLSARAKEGRVVLVEVDPRVSDAISVALSPWGLRVTSLHGPVPGAEVGAAAEGARTVASDQRADAVVWIAAPRQANERSSLWVYDAQTQQLAVRPLYAAAPFTDTEAAAVALSVKTILRASPLLAEPDRPEAPQPERPAPAEAPTVTRSGTGATPGRTLLRFESAVGGRVPTGSSSAVEPWVALGGSFWPARVRPLGFGLDLQAGPGTSVQVSAFRGLTREASAEITARLRGAVAPWISFELGAGPALYVTSFDGSTVTTNVGSTVTTNVHAIRSNPALDVGGVVDFTGPGRVGLGVVGEASTLLLHQTYFLDGAKLFVEPPMNLLAGIRLSLEVD
jgi:hypothetical protein